MLNVKDHSGGAYICDFILPSFAALLQHYCAHRVKMGHFQIILIKNESYRPVQNLWIWITGCINLKFCYFDSVQHTLPSVLHCENEEKWQKTQYVLFNGCLVYCGSILVDQSMNTKSTVAMAKVALRLKDDVAIVPSNIKPFTRFFVSKRAKCFLDKSPLCEWFYSRWHLEIMQVNRMVKGRRGGGGRGGVLLYGSESDILNTPHEGKPLGPALPTVGMISTFPFSPPEDRRLLLLLLSESTQHW